MICPYCAGVSNERICPYCDCEIPGYQTTEYSMRPVEDKQPIIINNYYGQQDRFNMSSPKSKNIALLLCVLGGGIGLHYFYVGRFGMGILFFFTGGLFGFGWIIDFLRILFGGFRDSNGMTLRWNARV